jgi:alpha-methylacyl-CoA racemase
MATSPRRAALDGTTVLDFSTVGPASRCTRILADYGALVVKIGAPPRQGGVQLEAPFFAYAGGRGTKRVKLDLKAPDGRAAFLRLAERADVVVESFRPGVVRRLGVGYEAVRAVNPRIVYCSTSGYGQEGPAAGWAGHDLDYLAMGGFLASSGPGAGGAPPLPGATIADGAAGGMHAAIAILAALLRRAQSGEGEYLDVAVADGVLSLMALAIDEHLATGAEVGPGHDILTGRYACYGVYRCRDGRFLAVAAIEPAFYANLCRALGLEAWVPRQSEDGAQAELRAAFAAAFAQRDRDEWVAKLAGADTCVAPVYEVSELVRDAHFAARGAFVEALRPEGGRFRQLAPLLAGCEPLPGPAQLPDLTSTDTDALLRGAGYSAEDLSALRREGVIA